MLKLPLQIQSLIKSSPTSSLRRLRTYKLYWSEVRVDNVSGSGISLASLSCCSLLAASWNSVSFPSLVSVSRPSASATFSSPSFTDAVFSLSDTGFSSSSLFSAIIQMSNYQIMKLHCCAWLCPPGQNSHSTWISSFWMGLVLTYFVCKKHHSLYFWP